MAPLPIIPSKVATAPSLHIVARASSPTPWEACKGCIAPGSINNKWYFALFALLFLAIVLGIVYFFFLARNGGFKYEPTDWDDYKTVVLRRTDSEGKTIVSSSRTDASRHTAAHLAALSVVATDKKGRKGILAKRGWAGTHSFTYADRFTNYDGKTLPDRQKPAMSEIAESDAPSAHSRRYRDRGDDLASYARESAAKVGGLNRPRDGQTSSVTSSEPSSRPNKKKTKRVMSEAEKMERRWRREARANAARMAEQARADEDRRSNPAARRREGEGSYRFSQPEQGRKSSYIDSYRPGR